MSAIVHWPASERPRERLLAQSPAALTDAELLSIVLGAGNASSLDLARELLGRHRTLSRLFGEPVADLAGAAGIGPAKAAKLKAGIELARRLLREEMSYGNALTSPEAVRDYLRLTLASLPHETFVVLFLDSQHRLLAAEELFRGTLAQTSVYPREVVKVALARNAAAVIFSELRSGVQRASRGRRTRGIATRCRPRDGSEPQPSSFPSPPRRRPSYCVSSECSR